MAPPHGRSGLARPPGAGRECRPGRAERPRGRAAQPEARVAGGGARGAGRADAGPGRGAAPTHAVDEGRRECLSAPLSVCVPAQGRWGRAVPAVAHACVSVVRCDGRLASSSSSSRVMPEQPWQGSAWRVTRVRCVVRLDNTGGMVCLYGCVRRLGNDGGV